MECNWKDQLKLHKELGPKIRGWRRQEPPLIMGAELTPHANGGYLSAILDLPHIGTTLETKPELPEETIDKLPEEITQYIKAICIENAAKLSIYNHEAEMKRGKDLQGTDYYCNRPFSEILRWGSFGTELALEVLQALEAKRDSWKTDADLRSHIYSEVEREFGRDYGFKRCVCHFVYNPLGLRRYPWGMDEEEEFLSAPVLTGDNFLQKIKERMLD